MKSDKTVNTEIDDGQGNTVTELLNKPVILDVPVLRGTTQITEVTVNKPNAGALRGTRLQELIETDVNSLITVLPRITFPALTANEVASLDPADLYQLSQALALFSYRVRSDPISSTANRRRPDGGHCRRFPLAANRYRPDAAGRAVGMAAQSHYPQRGK